MTTEPGLLRMIISHSRKFVFVKPRKTAGTSVEMALSPVLEAGDFATLVEPEEEAVRNVKPEVHVGSIYYGGGIKRGRLRDHSPISKAVDCFGERILDYQIVTMTRNPWSRAVSQFYWSSRRSNIRHRSFAEQKVLFNAYTRKWGPQTWLDRVYGRKRQRSLNASSLYQYKGVMVGNFAIRYEMLQADLDRLSVLLKLPDVRLPEHSFKSGLRNTSRPWQDFFDPDLRDLVANECREEIELFGYRFEADEATRGPEL